MSSGEGCSRREKHRKTRMGVQQNATRIQSWQASVFETGWGRALLWEWGAKNAKITTHVHSQNTLTHTNMYICTHVHTAACTISTPSSPQPRTNPHRTTDLLNGGGEDERGGELGAAEDPRSDERPAARRDDRRSDIAAYACVGGV